MGGWANCGTDSEGRPIGYAHEATCDHPGCEEKIDRGLAYACGSMHGSDWSCEKYFCSKHLHCVCLEKIDREDIQQLCIECKAVLEEEYYEDTDAYYRPKSVEVTAENYEDYLTVYNDLYDVLSPPLTEEQTERMNTVGVALKRYEKSSNDHSSSNKI